MTIEEKATHLVYNRSADILTAIKSFIDKQKPAVLLVIGRKNTGKSGVSRFISVALGEKILNLDVWHLPTQNTDFKTLFDRTNKWSPKATAYQFNEIERSIDLDKLVGFSEYINKPIIVYTNKLTNCTYTSGNINEKVYSVEMTKKLTDSQIDINLIPRLVSEKKLVITTFNVVNVNDTELTNTDITALKKQSNNDV